ncbi:MAG: class I SAM-dependent methyltransferase [Deltaproteobacteria bacterium]|nr:class I SAM-dependent methyltransferase [Deltaproteobacteria bacterium]MBW1962594.1 class I SAM-dependent methyltransferase [Deltaproteobacteria bacterium]
MPNSSLPDDFYDNINPRLFRRIGRELCLAGRVLDLGCGSCKLASFLAETYHIQVTGVDISSESFPELSSSSDGKERIRCIRKDAEHLDFMANESADAVVTKMALHEMEHPEAILREAYRILRPGGEILIVDYPKNSLAQKIWNENYYRPAEIEKILAEAQFYNIRVNLIEKGQIIWAKGFRPPAS